MFLDVVLLQIYRTRTYNQTIPPEKPWLCLHRLACVYWPPHNQPWNMRGHREKVTCYYFRLVILILLYAQALPYLSFPSSFHTVLENMFSRFIFAAHVTSFFCAVFFGCRNQPNYYFIEPSYSWMQHLCTGDGSDTCGVHHDVSHVCTPGRFYLLRCCNTKRTWPSFFFRLCCCSWITFSLRNCDNSAGW